MTPTGQSDALPLNILMLGPPMVTRNGQLVHINRREQRAGLFYLAAHMEPVSREEICNVFWPEDTEAVARKKLREGLSRLRTVLKDPTLIISDNDFVSLNPDRVYVDGREYNTIVTPLLNSSDFKGSGILPEWMYIQLRKAMDLCRGHQFLQNAALHNSSGYDSWLTMNNQSYLFSYEKIIERLAGHCIALGNIDEAILWLGKISAFDTLNTDVNYLMLKCLRDRRRFKEALDYLLFLDQAYRANHPDGLPEVLKELQKLIKHDALQTRDDQQFEWPGENNKNIPFVGRADLLERLNNAYQRKGIVHVTGVTGSGKNRLVQEFYSRLEYSPRLLFCVGKPMISTTPYSPLVEGLNRLITEKEWLALPDEIKVNLHSLYPELKFSDKRLSPIIIDKLSEHPVTRIQNALYSLLMILAEKKPLLMVLDIARWCDEATLQFLSFLNEQHFFGKYGLLILISRSEEHNPSLDAYIDQGVITSNLERMVLQPFTLEETSQFISMEFGKTVSEALVKKIQNQTGGNPYLLVETLKAIDPNKFNVLTFSETDHFPIPATIKSIVNEKTRALSDKARTVLISASILGQRFFLQILEKMMNMEFDELLSALEELQESGILIGSSGVQKNSYYEFPHDQFREVILEELSPVRKRGLHHAAVRAMLEVKGEAADQASTYAWHYEQAGDYSEAFSAWCVAGRYSRNCFSQADAYAAYQRALDLFSDLPSEKAPVLLQQLILEWGDYAYDNYDDLTCEKLFKKGLEYGEARFDPLLIGVSISGLGRVAEMHGEVEDGIELHQRALFYLSKTDANAEKLETYARLGILYELKDDYPLALETFLSGLSIENNFSDRRVLDASVNLKTQLSILFSMMGFPAKAEQMADQAANESKLINRLSGRVHAYTALAMAQYFAGKYQKSLQNAFVVYKLAENLNLDWWISLLDFTVARDYLVLGQLDNCWNHLHHAVENKDPGLLHKTIHYHHVIKGDLFRLLGDYSSAEEQYRLGIAQPRSDLQYMENYFGLGLALCQRNDLIDGLQIMKEALSKAESLGLESISMTGKVMLMAWENPEVEEDTFIRVTLPIVNELKERGFGTSGLTVNIIAGGISLRRGDVVKARSRFLAVAETSRNLGHRWNELWSLCALLSMEEKNSLEAKQYLEQKNKILEELGEHVTNKQLILLVRKFTNQMLK